MCESVFRNLQHVTGEEDTAHNQSHENRVVVSLRRIRDPKSVRLKDRDYDVTPNIIAHMYPQIRNGSVKECEVYCGDG